MEQLIEEALTDALRFYEAQGIATGGAITVKLLNEDHPLHRGVIAQVPGQLQSIRDLGEALDYRLSVRHLPTWYARRGIRISGQAADETARLKLLRARDIVGLHDEKIRQLNSHGVDILIYRSIRKVQAANTPEQWRTFLDMLLAHEAWHVIEGRKGLLNSIIIEGTAEFASGTYTAHQKSKYNIPDLRMNTARDYLARHADKHLYVQGKRIVARHAAKLTDLLDVNVRKKMEQDLHEYLDRVMSGAESSSASFDSKGQLVRLWYPAFSQLDTGVTKENLIACYHNSGALHLAQELQAQDCTRLLLEYRLMGFGPKQLT